MATVEEFKKELCYKADNAGATLSVEEIAKADAFAEGYKKFLNEAKTEREATQVVLSQAKEKGFQEFVPGKKYEAGDKLYYVNRDKAIILAVIGKKGIEEGVKIAAAHIDSPRLDLKPNPLYESDEIALFKTHYYGGIKKYQWVAIPLALHGVVVKKDGTKVTVKIGEEECEPKFVISDILPHLGAEQAKRTLSEGISGEELNVIVGSRPFKSDEGSELVKLNILKLLNEKYGIVESDFLSAELEVVPAFKADDIGFDRSLIGSYGHDDRVCAYPAAMAAFDVEAPDYTVISVLTDKEETGSDGNTGLQSSYLKYFIAYLAKANGLEVYQVLSKSECLSADVNSAYDPTFNSVFEKNNTSYLNKGVVITKYTGARGKSGTSDASAEYMGKIRAMLDKANVVWQIGELGKVDAGGGGTVAKYIANLDIDVVDLGVPVLSMHAPYEVISKLDLYMAYKAFYAFFKQ
ncbi:MAG: aminopeptidase [Clostridia bacterium]|nr:aminopeptidase [Clostridia bacterium]MBO5433040.1 aminopeptidase [Clostridia bacterium]